VGMSSILLGLAFGDCYGLEYEMLWPSPRYYWLDERELCYGCVEDRRRGPCLYSDDTEMSIALGEYLLEVRGFSEEGLARFFVRRLGTDVRERFYSLAMKMFVDHVRSGGQWYGFALSAYGPNLLDDPSPVVRAATIAISSRSDEACLELAARQAATTHGFRPAVEGAMAFALVLKRLIEGSPPLLAIEEVLDLRLWSPCLREAVTKALELVDDLPHRVVEELSSLPKCLQCLATAIIAFIRSGGRGDRALAASISMGGDVDTRAAIACSMVAAHRGLDAFPRDRVMKIEHCWYIRGLGERLWRLRDEGVLDRLVRRRLRS